MSINYDLAPVVDEDDYNKIKPVRDFLRALKFHAKTTETGKGGHYGTPNGDRETDLGDSITVIPFTWTPKAIDSSSRPASVSFRVSDPEFQRIMALEKAPRSGCFYGYSFLVYELATASFYDLFVTTPSSRDRLDALKAACPLTAAKLAANADKPAFHGLKPHGPQWVTLASSLMKTGNGSFYVIDATRHAEDTHPLPADELVNKELARFGRARVTNDEPVTPSAPASMRTR
jgi:hypothetical protein